MTAPLRIGTRTSELAVVQSTQIQEALQSKGIVCELVKLESRGDQNQNIPLYELQPTETGLFTKHLENALLANTVDIAVHSLKDLPTQQPDGLKLSAVPKRVNREDVLIVNESNYDPNMSLGIRKNASVGTSSLRREANLLSLRPDLTILPIRGNVPTRVNAVRQGKVHGVVLARAGLDRLNLDLSDLKLLPLDQTVFVPAPGQGALGIETRSTVPEELQLALNSLHDERSSKETQIERRVLRLLEGGCTLPLGVRCEHTLEGELELNVFLGLYKEKGVGVRQWTSFHRFDLVCDEPEPLIQKCLSALKPWVSPAAT